MSNSINGLPPGLDALGAARLQAESKKSNGALGQEDFLAQGAVALLALGLQTGGAQRIQSRRQSVN